MKTQKVLGTGGLAMLRRLVYWFGAPCLMLAATLPLTGTAWAQVPFAAITAKGEVSVDDPIDPSTLRFDLKSSFSLGPKSNGIDPTQQGLKLVLTYAGAVEPDLNVFVPAACFTQSGSTFKMSDPVVCGVDITLGQVKLLPAVDDFDLRLKRSPNGQWDLKVSIDFAPTKIGPAGVIAILRSPSAIGLSIGTSDAGEVLMRRIEFAGALPMPQG